MKHTFFFSFLLCVFTLQAQTAFDFTKLENRKKHDQRLVNDVILGSLKKPLSKDSEEAWQGAFWAMELMLYKTAFTKSKVAAAWKEVTSASEFFQKALLEVSYTLYPNDFARDAKKLMNQTTSNAVFVRCGEYLFRSKKPLVKTNYLLALTKQKMEGSDDKVLPAFLNRLIQTSQQQLPPMKDLFSKNFLPGHTVIFSLQRKNRDYPGLVIIRKEDGSFVRKKNGALFTVSQLARAITDYPFYITNGNTPQGIFRWTGFDTSSITYIGPTPNLQLEMPHEVSPAVYLADSSLAGDVFTEDQYASLLPPSWKKYEPIYESFVAGAIGRSEIIMHGTTINPAYYKNQSYYPQTPSLGCLCSYEEWDADGKQTISNQQKLVDKLKGIGSNKGYVVVIDIDDKKEKVQLDEVEKLVR